MSSTFFRKLPTPLEIKTMYPVPEAVEKQKQINDEEIRKCGINMIKDSRKWKNIV